MSHGFVFFYELADSFLGFVKQTSLVSHSYFQVNIGVGAFEA